MIKVLLVMNSLSSGGAEVFVTQLAKALSLDCEVKLLTFAGELDQKGADLKKYLENNNIEYISLNANSAMKKMTVPASIASVIQKWKPDIIHVHMRRSEQFVFLSSLLTWHKFRAIRTKHDERPYRTFNLNWLMNRFYKINIACSNSAYIALKNMGLSENSIVIKNGIDTELLTNIHARQKSDIRSTLGIHPDKIMCLNIGSMHSEETGFQKAQDIILSAIANGNLARKCNMVFLGSGTGIELLRAQSVRLGLENSILFEGVVSNVMDYVACADILVMPSRWEGLPIAAIEVACSGVPMLLSNISSFDEFCTKSVVKCEPGSVDSLISAMTDAFVRLSELKREAKLSSLEYRREYSIRNVAETHIKLYKHVLLSS